ncbi:response regulator transcription factor [Rhodoplanes sp. Z2-YC6860]|uniref:response regulator transcription factor n=1 Tax=Rhodoplanes sp. Z2-YC6860 TaxID=674703 RepID=UPI00078CD7B3|nr:response regulator transcription factor [Rhodoplanes sp. Z2-YC6860]AMN41376.1 two component LuxR family transcriptional regulator [Rhodoplanes sp. Z2-YC6860]
MTTKSTIALCDDHPIVLGGLRNLIESEPDFDIVGTATDGLAALKLINEKRPDIALIDISMPELNGIALARRLADEAPSVRVVVLTVYEDRAFLKQALDAGVRGYLLKRSAAESLIQALRAVLTGGIYVDPAIADRIFVNNAPRQGRGGDKPLMPALTERESEVLKLTALGFTNKETARRLDIGVKSVETYKARGLEKLGLSTRAELVRYASAEGWLANL